MITYYTCKHRTTKQTLLVSSRLWEKHKRHAMKEGWVRWGEYKPLVKPQLTPSLAIAKALAGHLPATHKESLPVASVAEIPNSSPIKLITPYFQQENLTGDFQPRDTVTSRIFTGKGIVLGRANEHGIYHVLHESGARYVCHVAYMQHFAGEVESEDAKGVAA